MDAATLYMVVTLPNGAQTTSTKQFRTLQACEAHAASQQQQDYAHPQQRGAIIEYRCVEHPMIPGGFILAVCQGPNAPCAEVGPWSRQRCDAHRWMVRLKDGAKKRIIYCWGAAPTGVAAAKGPFQRRLERVMPLATDNRTRGGRGSLEVGYQ